MLVDVAAEEASPPALPDIAAGSSWWQRRRYAALATLLLVLLAAHATTERWSGDFWLHAATVEAIAEDPLSPANPTQSSDAPSAIVSPYTVVVGIGARLAGVGAVAALGVASVLLALGFVLLLPPVVRGLTSNARAPFWALAATLVVWGADPLVWSGYLDLDALVLVAPYPAMAAWCCVLAAAWALLRLCDGARPLPWAALLGGAAACTVIVHPISTMTLGVLLGAIAVGRRRTLPLIPVALAAAASLVVVVAWPYWHLWDLASGGSDLDDFHGALYDGVLGRSWPLLVGLPVLVWRARRDATDPLVLAGAGALALVVTGWVADVPTLGRVFPLLGLVAHTAFGDGLGRLEARGDDEPPTGVWRTAVWLAVAGLVAFGAWQVRDGARTALGWSDDTWGPTVGDAYAFADPLISRDDVVLAPLVPAAYLAGLGAGRPVATVWEERLAADDAERRADVERFFADDTTPAARLEIIDRWQPDVVVVETASPSAPQIEAALATIAVVEHRDDAVAVWRLDRA